MKIEYFGHSCFRIENQKGERLVVDPYTCVGYELPNGLIAELVLVSHSHFDHSYTDGIQGSPVVIDTAGRFTYGDFEITSEECWHDSRQGALRGKNLLFKIKADGMCLAHFGDLGESYSLERAKMLSDVDVFMIPVGGTYTIDAEQAKEYIENLLPKLAIPMHYLPKDGALDIAPIDVFLLKMQDYSIQKEEGSIELSKEFLQTGKTKIIYMERQK